MKQPTRVNTCTSQSTGLVLSPSDKKEKSNQTEIVKQFAHTPLDDVDDTTLQEKWSEPIDKTLKPKPNAGNYAAKLFYFLQLPQLLLLLLQLLLLLLFFVDAGWLRRRPKRRRCGTPFMKNRITISWLDIGPISRSTWINSHFSATRYQMSTYHWINKATKSG